jgi:hypothetical protein
VGAMWKEVGELVREFFHTSPLQGIVLSNQQTNVDLDCGDVQGAKTCVYGEVRSVTTCGARRCAERGDVRGGGVRLHVGIWRYVLDVVQYTNIQTHTPSVTSNL